MPESNGKTPVRITITLDEEVYDKVQTISNMVGLRPATLVSMLTTSRVNNMDLQIKKIDETVDTKLTEILQYSHP